VLSCDVSGSFEYSQTMMMKRERERCETYVAWFPSLVVLNRKRQSDECGPETDRRIFPPIAGARHTVDKEIT
jgi:hypothetical protein